MNKDEIALYLVAIEPNLVRLARDLSPKDYQAVEELTHDSEPRVRANAITLQSMIDEDAFLSSFERAIDDNERIVRLQALASINNISLANALKLSAATLRFLKDPDVGVRKLAIKASIRSADEQTTEELRNIAKSDDQAFLRSLATDAISRLP